MPKRPDFQEEMFSQLQTREIFEQAKSHAYAYLDGQFARNVYPTDQAIGNMEIFDEPLPTDPGNPAEILRLMHEYGSPATVAQTGGRYFGFVNGGAIPVALAARWLSDVWDQCAGLYVISPLVAQLETTCEKWLVDLFGLPFGTAAGFVSGSSSATFCGLAAARNELLKRQGWDVNADGLFGAPNLRVIVGEQAHASVFKALALLGLGKARVELVPTDDQGRMLADKIPALDDNCLVIAQAGNVNTGAFDPIDQICDLASGAGAWVHIDGAFGLWAACSRTKKSLTDGLEKADSWSVDAHKTLNSPYDSGIILCKDREALVTAMHTSASYLHYSERRDGMQYTPEMSRRARAVELWAILKFFGKDGVEQLVDRLCDHASRFAVELRAQGFHILNEVVFNQVLVACDTPEQTRATLENIQKSGELWCGGTVWNGAPVIRI
ncbi:MAG TPA: aminotransferase class V-fold PLP-dependent enzyme, partial [Anaerolineales bacterium]|nr:aminotransferase class V-fold PLP-dependent enzyme [Anaerolineales bacterium]